MKKRTVEVVMTVRFPMEVPKYYNLKHEIEKLKKTELEDVICQEIMTIKFDFRHFKNE